MGTAKQAATPAIMISKNWQLAYTAVTILGWLVSSAAIILLLSTDYTSPGTWAFQATVILLPVIFFVLSFMVLYFYPPGLKRLFMTSLASTIGMGLYGVVAMAENTIRTRFLPITALSPTDRSWWTAFGNEWATMIACLVLFGGLLFVVTHKSSR